MKSIFNVFPQNAGKFPLRAKKHGCKNKNPEKINYINTFVQNDPLLT